MIERTRAGIAEAARKMLGREENGYAANCIERFYDFFKQAGALSIPSFGLRVERISYLGDKVVIGGEFSNLPAARVLELNVQNIEYGSILPFSEMYIKIKHGINMWPHGSSMEYQTDRVYRKKSGKKVPLKNEEAHEYVEQFLACLTNSSA